MDNTSFRELLIEAVSYFQYMLEVQNNKYPQDEEFVKRQKADIDLLNAKMSTIDQWLTN